jgi:YfiH family protein
VTDRPGVVLGIRVADCVPLLALDASRRAIGLAHAGWRGTLAGVAASLVRAMADAFGSRPADLACWIGPSIGPECFEVGDDVRARFEVAFGASVAARDRRVDLWRANAAALARAGVDPARIETVSLCTVCRSDLLHSHRASRGLPGRNLVFLAIRPAA